MAFKDVETQREYMREWRKNNKEKVNKYMRDYLSRHPDKKEEKKEYQRKYYEEHKDLWKGRVNKEAFNRFKKTHDWTKYCAEARRRRVERLRKEGCTNAWSVVTKKGVEPKYKESKTQKGGIKEE